MQQFALEPTLKLIADRAYHGAFLEALQLCEELFVQEQKNVMVRFCLARLKIAVGQWQQGLALFDSVRGHGVFGGDYITQQKPLWDGTTSLFGQRVLLSSEGGLGDIVCFSRFVMQLQNKGAKVLLAAPVEMFPILRSLPADVHLISPKAAELVDYDWWLPALSAPRLLALQHEQIGGEPFLSCPLASAQKWASRLQFKKPRVGLIWQGNPQFAEDQYRSLRASLLLPLLQNKNYQFLTMQGTHSHNPLQNQNLIDVSSQIEGPNDLAGFCANIDFFISVDTGPAHLAAAMGTPTLLLNRLFGWFTFSHQFAAGLQKTPWYNSMTLLNQKNFMDWEPEISMVREQIDTLFSLRNDLRSPQQMYHPQHPPIQKELVKTTPTRLGHIVICPNDYFVGQALEVYGEYSQQESEIILAHLKPGDVAVDAGAQLGYFSYLMAEKVGPQGRVISFEPQEFFKKLIELNGMTHQWTWLECRAEGLSDSTGTGFLPPVNYNKVGNFGATQVTEEPQTQAIPLLKLDDLDLPKLDFIKMDIEGMELQALAGAEKTIRNHRPTLWIEIDREPQRTQILQRLTEWGYHYEEKLTPLYNPDNFKNKAENIFGTAMTHNVLAVKK